MPKNIRTQEKLFRNHFIFTVSLERNPALARKVLKILTGHDFGVLTSAIREDELKATLYAKECILDLRFIEEHNINQVDLDLQTYKEKYPFDRSDFYAASLTTNSILEGDSYDKLPYRYTIFLCSYDITGSGRAVESSRMYFDSTKQSVNDKDVRFFINYNCEDENIDNELKELFSLLKGENVVPKNEVVRELKEEEEKVKRDADMMTLLEAKCKLIERSMFLYYESLSKEEKAEYFESLSKEEKAKYFESLSKEEKAEYFEPIYEEKWRRELLTKLKQKGMSDEDISNLTDFSISEIQEYLK